jgi:phospholipid/cholesterol/gamma-HCH transport system substrate-binding protein
MQKQAPTLGRMLIMVSFALSCFGLLLFLWLAFGGSIPLEPKGYRVKVAFSEATQLAQEADVRISGVPVGKVKTIELDRSGRSVATIELQRRYAPLPADARAILRQKTLLGETYIELTPGNRGTGTVREGGSLPVGNVSPTVELDEIFRTLNARTRREFQLWMQTLAQGTAGRGQDINDAFGNLAPFTEDATDILRVLNSQQAVVQRLVSNTGEVFGALSERNGQLADLIRNSNTVFRTTAERNTQLQDTFRVLPTFERESQLTLDRLARFSQTTNPLITQLRPAARELSPTLVDLSALAPDLKAFFIELNPLITASRRGLPALRRFLDDLRPLLGEFDPFLRQVNPIIQFVGLHRRELVAFFANTAATTQATDRPRGSLVHYLRTTNPVNPENLAVYNRRIATNRPNAYQLPNGFDRLGSYLQVYENRHCNVANTVPLPPTGLGGIVTPQILTLINQFVYGQAGNPGALPAPPCEKRPPFSFGGFTGDYPHVTAQPPGR